MDVTQPDHSYHPWSSTNTGTGTTTQRSSKKPIIIGSNWSKSLTMTSAFCDNNTNSKYIPEEQHAVSSSSSSPPTLTVISGGSSSGSSSSSCQRSCRRQSPETKNHRLGISPGDESSFSATSSELTTDTNCSDQQTVLLPFSSNKANHTTTSTATNNDSISVGVSSQVVPATRTITSQTPQDHRTTMDSDFSASTELHRNAINMDSISTGVKLASTAPLDWTIPKWKELENKRLALCQKRVHLERRLFEFSATKLGAEGRLQLEQLPVVKIKKNYNTGHQQRQTNSNNDVGSCSDSTASQSSAGSSNGTSSPRDANKNNTRGQELPTASFKLRRYQIKKDQDPVLWSGSVNRRNQPDGDGRMVFSDGQVYEGTVRAGLRQGKGVNVWPNGQIYTGSWNNNSRSGRGTHRWPDGRTVTGPWLNGHLHGRVFFCWPDGATYDGDTVKGQKEGRGIHTWKDGRVYNGQYKNGSENGIGTLTEPNQHTKYRGHFVDGKRNGYGIQIWKTKSYDGQWYQNMIHGQGKLTWLSGACYIGEFKNGRYHGIGSYRSETGAKYVGTWKDGNKHGKGKQSWPDGGIYQGSFKDNKRHGYGRMVYPDGSIYAGGWEYGNRVGCGIEIASMMNDLNGELHKEIRHCGLWVQDAAVVNTKKKSVLDVSMDDSQIMLSSCGDKKDPNTRNGKGRVIAKELP